MDSKDRNNRWAAFTDEELRILSSALYCSTQYAEVTGQSRFLEQEIRKELADRRYGVNVSGTNY